MMTPNSIAPNNRALPCYRPALTLALMVCILTAFPAHRAEAQNIDFDALEVIFGEEITTSANGSPQRASEVAATMDIITAEQIRSSGAMTIPDILKRVAGVHIRQYSSTQQDVSVRGYASPLNQRMMVLINGRSVYIGFFGAVAWETLPVSLNQIRQIEVVRGPATALFGFNALAGAINIVTYDGQGDRRRTIATATSSSGDVRAELGLSGALSDTLTGHVSTRYSFLDAFDDPTNSPLVPPASADNFSASAGLVYVPNAATKISLEANGATGSIDSRTTNQIRIIPDVETLSGRLSARHTTGFGEVFADYYINDSSFEIPALLITSIDPNLLPPGFSLADIRTQGEFSETLYNASAGAYVTAFDRLTIRALGEYRRLNVTQSIATNVSLDSTALSLETWSASGLVDWQATDTLRFSLSARFDRQTASGEPFEGDRLTADETDLNDTDFSGLSYNASVLWKLTDTSSLRLSAARGIRVPSAAELALFGDVPAPAPQLDLLIVGNPNSERTSLDQFEISFERRLPAIDGRFRITGFYQINNDIESLFGSLPVPIGDSGLVGTTSRNVLDSDAFGFEIELEGKITDAISFGANYSLIDLRDHNETDRVTISPPELGGASVTVLAYPTEFEQQTSNHLANIWVSGKWGAFNATLEAHYISSRQEPSAYNFLRPFTLAEVNDQLLLGGQIGYQVREGIRLVARGQNLGAGRQFLNGSQSGPVERRVWFGLEWDF